MTRALRYLLPAMLALSAWHPAAAEDVSAFPSRTIRIIVPFPAGGPSDIVARVIAQKMSEDWGQPVVVENRPGALETIAMGDVLKQPADGRTVYVMSVPTTAAPALWLLRLAAGFVRRRP